MQCPHCGAYLDPDDLDEMLGRDDRKRRWQSATDAEALREAEHPSNISPGNPQ
jgi:hypothetical protein